MKWLLDCFGEGVTVMVCVTLILVVSGVSIVTSVISGLLGACLLFRIAPILRATRSRSSCPGAWAAASGGWIRPEKGDGCDVDGDDGDDGGDDRGDGGGGGELSEEVVAVVEREKEVEEEEEEEEEEVIKEKAVEDGEEAGEGEKKE